MCGGARDCEGSERSGGTRGSILAAVSVSVRLVGPSRPKAQGDEGGLIFLLLLSFFFSFLFTIFFFYYVLLYFLFF